jgi:hypothetical protein
MKFIRKAIDKFGKKHDVKCDPSDPKPIEVALDAKRVESQDERIRRIIREQIRPESYGYESEEDAEDFEVEDDADLLGELPITPEEMAYVQSQHPELTNEILIPNSSPDQGSGGDPDPALATDSGKPAPDSPNHSPPLEDGKESE